MSKVLKKSETFLIEILESKIRFSHLCVDQSSLVMEARLLKVGGSLWNTERLFVGVFTEKFNQAQHKLNYIEHVKFNLVTNWKYKFNQ